MASNLPDSGAPFTPKNPELELDMSDERINFTWLIFVCFLAAETEEEVADEDEDKDADANPDADEELELPNFSFRTLVNVCPDVRTGSGTCE